MRKANVIPMKVHLEKLSLTREIERQMMWDAVTIALNDEFGFGKERILKLLKAVEKRREDIARLFIGDTKDMEYAKSVLDRRLREICGDEFLPWEERYKP